MILDCMYIGIGGSFMGGLISIYVGLMYLEVYGRLLIFLFLFWVVLNIYFYVINLEEVYDIWVYIYVGEGESNIMVLNIKNF